MATELGARIRALERDNEELRGQLAEAAGGGGREEARRLVREMRDLEGELERAHDEKEAAEKEAQRVRGRQGLVCLSAWTGWGGRREGPCASCLMSDQPRTDSSRRSWPAVGGVRRSWRPCVIECGNCNRSLRRWRGSARGRGTG